MKRLLLDILILSTAAFGILWLLDSTANSQECPDGKCPTSGWRAPAIKNNPAVVRVFVKEGNGPRAIGSGVVFRQRGKVAYVLTAAHVIRDRIKNGVTVWTGKQLYQATVLACNETWDVAILRIADPKIKPLILADNPPRPGDSVECSGLGQNGTFRYFQGPVTQYVSPGKQHPFEWIEVRAVVRQGDSGGPIVNKKGRIVGLITGSDHSITVGPCLPRIRKIVDGLFGRKPSAAPLLRPVRPPLRPAPRPVKPVRELPSSTPLPAEINYNKLAEIILSKINPDDFRGPVGPVGPPGTTGARGEPGKMGSSGLHGPSEKFSDLTEDEKQEIAEAIKELINGSVRIKVQAITGSK